MSKWFEKALKVKPNLLKASQMLEDNESLEVKNIYPIWADLILVGQVEAETGYKFTYKEDLYKCVNANPTFQENWVPGEGTESLYVRIDETHAGTLEDPIPYNGNMILEKDKYYIQNDVIYLCIRDTGTPVYHELSALVGLYVSVVK